MVNNYSFNLCSDELYHHGILGMKWGVRRYQNADGSLTPAGKKRYEGNFIDRHQQKLVDKYKSEGYSESAAQTMAKQRMRTEAAIAIVGGIVIGVVAKKVITRIGQDYCDKVIKSGAVIQNIGANKDATFKDAPFFAAINKHDKKAYEALFAPEKKNIESMEGRNSDIFRNTIKVIRDVKMPSVNNARKIFTNKMNTDTQFRNEVLSTIKKTPYGKFEDVDKLLKTNPKKFYDRFNQALATPEFQQKGIHKKFYSELEKNGYNALLDINDTRYSGFKRISKSPTIFFGDDIVEKVGSTKLSDNYINLNEEQYLKELVYKQWGKEVAGVAGAVAVGKSVSDSNKVKNYLKEHPNSKLSRKEILKMYDA